MIIATLDKDDCVMIAHTLSNINHAVLNEVLIAFDPCDESFKLKINRDVWSPPIGKFQQPDNAAMRSWVNDLRELIASVAHAARELSRR